MRENKEKKEKLTRDRGFFGLLGNGSVEQRSKNQINFLMMEQEQIYSSELCGYGNGWKILLRCAII